MRTTRPLRHVLLATLVGTLTGLTALANTATAAPAPVSADRETASADAQRRGVVSATFTVEGGVTRTDGYNGCTRFPYTMNFQGTPDTGTWRFTISDGGHSNFFVWPYWGLGSSGTVSDTYEFCPYSMNYGTRYLLATVETTRTRSDGVQELELTYRGPADTDVTHVKPQPVLALTLSRRTAAPGAPVRGRVRGTGHYGEPVAGAEANKPPAIIVQAKRHGGRWRALLGDRILTTNKEGEATFNFRAQTGMRVRAILKETKEYYEATSKAVSLRIRR